MLIANKLSKLIRLNIFNITTAEGITAIAKALQDNTILINLGTWIKNADITKILERNKKIKDISEAFKPIISKITLDTDGTPLLSLDKEDSEQNSCLNKLKGYSKKYGELLLPALEQSIAQSL
ncbi:hypothetical protein [Rickettsia endosymbiont of Culicoides newsteadi]|uniref:hypothetical protein n=1 Tax=Rickettsia endosymbiont of Culicoides newsteadi TaxID=1961830 RepID=UPI000B9B49DD|nr:hypothetical protein [Rickettsia endosymbiont of Culicoides newsteadi]OZG31596.1 hypothetical protein RiCNE_10060 [Rickettsia endosymbiont of Culicoides newsteadi]